MDIANLINVFEDCELIEDKILIKKNFSEAIKCAKQLSYTMLKSITAVNLKDGYIELIYLLYSTENEEDLKISIITNSEAESIADIFPSAIADENEIYDMFGIHFLNNSDLKRLYMPENWDGYPLRKDYIQNDTRIVWNDTEKNV
jgi:NADH-quinone oxidoreductase subunit C